MVKVLTQTYSFPGDAFWSASWGHRDCRRGIWEGKLEPDPKDPTWESFLPGNA